MILTTHAIVGAAAGRVFSNPYVAFAAGFASHFIIDAIPHWEYDLKSRVENKENPLKEDITLNKKFIGDLARIGLDFAFGVFASIFIFRNGSGFIGAPASLLAGVAGGVFPDFLQFLYFKIRREPFILAQKLHIYVHKGGKKIPALPYGVVSQIILIIAAVIISKAVY
ncbi:MAG: hypothetical protein NTV77_03965 [Candidatus Azambacteria bacterium]|nr:hypothetical protein [Candidatus Azambacteria bacterium]